MSRTHRLFQLMQALRSLPAPVTAAQLAYATGVSPRTLYRDIDTLRELGAVIDGEAGFGYTLIEDAHLPPLGFKDDELEALVLGLREVAAVGDPALAEAAIACATQCSSRTVSTHLLSPRSTRVSFERRVGMNGSSAFPIPTSTAQPRNARSNR